MGTVVGRICPESCGSVQRSQRSLRSSPGSGRTETV